MKKYYGPIVLGIAALTVAAPIVNTTTVLAGVDDTTTDTKSEDDIIPYTGSFTFKTDSGEETRDTTVYLPSNAKVGDDFDVEAPKFDDYFNQPTDTFVSVIIGKDDTVTFSKDNLLTYSNSINKPVTFDTNLTDSNKTITTTDTVSLKVNEPTPVKVPTVNGYYSLDKIIYVTADKNGTITPDHSITYIKTDDDTVTGKATIASNLKDKTITSTDDITGQIGQDNLFVKVPQVDGYYTNQKQVKVNIDKNKNITTDKVTYTAKNADTVTGNVIINQTIGSFGNPVPISIPVSGQKDSTFNIDVPDLAGYKYDKDKFKQIVVNIYKDGTIKATPSTIDYYNHIQTEFITVPKTAKYPDGKWKLNIEYLNTDDGTGYPLPNIKGYYATDSEGKKTSSILIYIKDGKLSIHPITWHKISNNSNHHNTSSNTTKPTTKPETKPAQTKSIKSHQATFYALPNQITSLYNENGQVLKDRALSGNSSWLSDKLMTLDGVNYLRVATDEWAKLADGLEVNPISENIYTKNEARLYAANGDTIKTRALAKNSAWRTDKSATINGQTMYRVATNEWVSSADLK